MAKRPSRSKRKSNTPSRANDNRNPHAVALGAKGASKGGKARAAKTTPAQRKKIASQGGKSGGKGRPKKK